MISRRGFLRGLVATACVVHLPLLATPKYSIKELLRTEVRTPEELYAWMCTVSTPLSFFNIVDGGKIEPVTYGLTTRQAPDAVARLCTSLQRTYAYKLPYYKAPVLFRRIPFTTTERPFWGTSEDNFVVLKARWIFVK